MMAFELTGIRFGKNIHVHQLPESNQHKVFFLYQFKYYHVQLPVIHMIIIWIASGVVVAGI